MKRIAFVLLGTAAAWFMPLQAQSPQPTTAEAPAKPAAAYKFVEPRVVADYPLPSKADPRVCLEFATNAQIISCANRYLPGRRKS